MPVGPHVFGSASTPVEKSEEVASSSKPVTPSNDNSSAVKVAQSNSNETQNAAQNKTENAAANPAAANAGLAAGQIDLKTIPADKIIQHVDAAANNVVQLPPEASVDGVFVSGNDLLIRLSDGTYIQVEGGLAHMPTIMLGKVEIPGTLLADALQANGVTLPAAG
ncbi:MAG: hypothetical protein V4691_08460, partial [Pseudomonadota bacterium]